MSDERKPPEHDAPAQTPTRARGGGGAGQEGAGCDASKCPHRLATRDAVGGLLPPACFGPIRHSLSSPISEGGGPLAPSSPSRTDSTARARFEVENGGWMGRAVATVQARRGLACANSDRNRPVSPSNTGAAGPQETSVPDQKPPGLPEGSLPRVILQCLGPSLLGTPSPLPQCQLKHLSFVTLLTAVIRASSIAHNTSCDTRGLADFLGTEQFPSCSGSPLSSVPPCT